MAANLTVLNEMYLSKETRGMDYSRNSDLLAVSQSSNVLLMNLKQWASCEDYSTTLNLIESESYFN